MAEKNSLIPLKSLSFNFHATNTVIISFLPLYLQSKQLSGTEIGWILAIGPFASIFSQPFWGYLSDKYQTVKRILIISIVCTIIMSILFFQMNQLLTILLFGAMFYFFSSPVGALSDSLAQRRANELKISFGTIRMWGSLGFALSSLIVGEILTKIGIKWLVLPYVTLATLLLLISFMIKDVKSEPTSHIKFRDIRLLIKNKAFIFFLVVLMFVTIAHRANDSFMGIFLKELGGTESLVGTAWFIALLSEAAIFATAGFWFRKFHPIVFIIAASALYTIRWFIYGTTDSPFLVIGIQVLHGMTFATMYVAAFDYITKIIPTSLQSTGHLIFYTTMFGLSGIIGSMGGGWIIEQFGVHTLYLLMAFFTLIGMVFLSLFLYMLKKLVF